MRKRIVSKYQEEIKPVHQTKGLDQGEARVVAMDAGQAQAATACVRIVGNKLRTMRETPVLTRNVPNAER